MDYYFNIRMKLIYFSFPRILEISFFRNFSCALHPPCGLVVLFSFLQWLQIIFTLLL